jgi:hypothetical protein
MKTPRFTKEDVKRIESEHEELAAHAEKIFTMYCKVTGNNELEHSYVDSYDLGETTLTITTRVRMDYMNCDQFDLPAAYFFMTDEDLLKAITDDYEKVQRERRQSAERRRKQEEAEERAEYERLAEKYGN